MPTLKPILASSLTMRVVLWLWLWLWLWQCGCGIMEWCYIMLLQAYFEQRVIELVKELPSAKRTVLWEDNSKGHTSGLPKDAVVELWK
eukprot:COSAG06_NODE_25118_length_644_cov_3.605505_1_plen_87_part_10